MLNRIFYIIEFSSSSLMVESIPATIHDVASPAEKDQENPEDREGDTHTVVEEVLQRSLRCHWSRKGSKVWKGGLLSPSSDRF